MKKTSIGFLLIMFLFIFTACGNKNNNKEKKSEEKAIEKVEVKDNYKVGIEKGNKIPDVEIVNLMGGKQNLSQYKGKVVLLNFWATWCPPCRQEMPSMEEIYKNKDMKNFEIIAISVDREKTDKVSDFIIENKYSFPVFHDVTGKIAQRFLINSIPQTYIINEDGIIVDKITGAFDWNKLNIDSYKKKVD